MDYWYAVNTECNLYGISEISDNINLSIQSAFQFALTDGMKAKDRGLVAVLTNSNGVRSSGFYHLDNIDKGGNIDKNLSESKPEPELGSEPGPDSGIAEGTIISSHEDQSTEVYTSVAVRTWSPSLKIAQNVGTTINLADIFHFCLQI